MHGTLLAWSRLPNRRQIKKTRWGRFLQPAPFAFLALNGTVGNARAPISRRLHSCISNDKWRTPPFYWYFRVGTFCKNLPSGWLTTPRRYGPITGQHWHIRFCQHRLPSCFEDSWQPTLPPTRCPANLTTASCPRQSLFLLIRTSCPTKSYSRTFPHASVEAQMPTFASRTDG